MTRTPFVVSDLSKSSNWLTQVTRNDKGPSGLRKSVTTTLCGGRYPFFLQAWIFGWSHRGPQSIKQLLCCYKSRQCKQPKSVPLYQTQSPFTNTFTESNFTLITGQSWFPVTVTACLQKMNAYMKWSSVPCPVSVVANHPFIGHHFFKIRIGFNVICGDFPPAIILRGSRAGNKISLKFSALQISLHNHQPMPPFAVHPLTPPLMLLTPFLPSFAEPPLTSIQIVLSSCSFPFVCKSFHPQTCSPTTDAPSSYHPISFLPSAELLLIHPRAQGNLFILSTVLLYWIKKTTTASRIIAGWSWKAASSDELTDMPMTQSFSHSVKIYSMLAVCQALFYIYH